MEMSTFTLHINTACLLRHPIIITDIFYTCGLLQTFSKFLFRDCLILHLLPSTAMEQYALIQMQFPVFRFQSLIKTAPYHIGKTKKKHRTVSVFPLKLFDHIPFRVHFFIQRIKPFRTADGKSKDSGTSRRKHFPVFQNFRRIYDKHRNPLFSKPVL